MRSPFTHRSILGVLLLCLCVPVQAQARVQQNGSVIEGIITSGEGDKPLAGVLVTLVPLSVRHGTNGYNSGPDSLPADLASRTLLVGLALTDLDLQSFLREPKILDVEGNQF